MVKTKCPPRYMPRVVNVVDHWAYMLEQAKPGSTIRMVENVDKVYELTRDPAFLMAIKKGVKFECLIIPRDEREKRLASRLNLQDIITENIVADGLAKAYKRHGVDGVASYIIQVMRKPDGKSFSYDEAKVMIQSSSSSTPATYAQY